jgi:hypothetical protein
MEPLPWPTSPQRLSRGRQLLPSPPAADAGVEPPVTMSQTELVESVGSDLVGVSRVGCTGRLRTPTAASCDQGQPIPVHRRSPHPASTSHRTQAQRALRSPQPGSPRLLRDAPYLHPSNTYCDQPLTRSSIRLCVRHQSSGRHPPPTKSPKHATTPEAHTYTSNAHPDKTNTANPTHLSRPSREAPPYLATTTSPKAPNVNSRPRPAPPSPHASPPPDDSDTAPTQLSGRDRDDSSSGQGLVRGGTEGAAVGVGGHADRGV